MFFGHHQIKTDQEAPFVGGKDKTGDLRCGNINISDQLLKLPDQETYQADWVSRS
jgi:hypothetical protein